MKLKHLYEMRQEPAQRYAVIRVTVGKVLTVASSRDDAAELFGEDYVRMLVQKYSNSPGTQVYVLYDPETKKIYDEIEDTTYFHQVTKAVRKFTKADRSTFKYWFAHWCAFQIVALNLGIWKFKYLFHDFEKPWLRLFLSYKKVQSWHRWHNSHHLEYGLQHGFDRIDWEALMIDWECSGFSKEACPRDCRAEMEAKLQENKWKDYAPYVRQYLEPLLDKHSL